MAPDARLGGGCSRMGGVRLVRKSDAGRGQQGRHRDGLRVLRVFSTDRGANPHPPAARAAREGAAAAGRYKIPWRCLELPGPRGCSASRCRGSLGPLTIDHTVAAAGRGGCRRRLLLRTGRGRATGCTGRSRTSRSASTAAPGAGAFRLTKPPTASSPPGAKMHILAGTSASHAAGDWCRGPLIG